MRKHHGGKKATHARGHKGSAGGGAIKTTMEAPFGMKGRGKTRHSGKSR